MKDDSGTVKVEGEAGTKQRKQTRERTPSTELHVYTIPELMKFKKEELMAQTVYLEGKLSPSSSSFLPPPHTCDF